MYLAQFVRITYRMEFAEIKEKIQAEIEKAKQLIQTTKTNLSLWS